LPAPDVSLSQSLLVQVLIKSGKKEETRKQREFLVELDKSAVERTPQDTMAWQNLGWAQYLAGAWKESIETLEKSCKLQDGGKGDCCQWIVMSLAHAQLAAQDGLTAEEKVRHEKESRRLYDEAVAQLDTWTFTTHVFQTAQEFRAEAARQLKIEKKPKGN